MATTKARTTSSSAKGLGSTAGAVGKKTTGAVGSAARMVTGGLAIAATAGFAVGAAVGAVAGRLSSPPPPRWQVWR
jgi:uncharacterized membrane protein